VAGILFNCSRCGKRLKARNANVSVRCPICGIVLHPPLATEEEETIDRLEEVPAPSQRPPRQRKRVRRDPDWSLVDHLWLFAAGAGFLVLVGSFIGSLVICGEDGIAERHIGKGDAGYKQMELIFGILAGLACYVGGVFGVKNRELRGRLVVTRGPVAVVLSLVMLFLGAWFGGVALYGLLNFLAHGR
jgi:hypothetical protein